LIPSDKVSSTASFGPDANEQVSVAALTAGGQSEMPTPTEALFSSSSPGEIYLQIKKHNFTRKNQKLVLLARQLHPRGERRLPLSRT